MYHDNVIILRKTMNVFPHQYLMKPCLNVVRTFFFKRVFRNLIGCDWLCGCAGCLFKQCRPSRARPHYIKAAVCHPPGRTNYPCYRGNTWLQQVTSANRMSYNHSVIFYVLDLQVTFHINSWLKVWHRLNLYFMQHLFRLQ